MSGHRGHRVALSAVVVLGLVVTGVTVHARQVPPAEVSVMTRNLYLGADITRPLRAVSGLAGLEALEALGHSSDDVARTVRRTNARVRARLLGAEVATARPDLLAVQEAVVWRSGPLQLDAPGRLDATRVDVDLLALLLDDLERRETPYDVVVSQMGSDVEAPAFRGSADAPVRGRDVRVTVADAILVRRGSPVVVQRTGGAAYQARTDVDLAGVGVSFVRGYVWADVEVGGHGLRFVGTHLESEPGPALRAQAVELLAGPASDQGRPVVVACDCNSDPGDPTGAYDLLTADDRVDAWAEVGRGRGTTGVFPEVPVATDDLALTRRLDLVLLSEAGIEPLDGARTGVYPSDADATTGLRGSDHAGVVMRLRLS